MKNFLLKELAQSQIKDYILNEVINIYIKKLYYMGYRKGNILNYIGMEYFFFYF